MWEQRREAGAGRRGSVRAPRATFGSFPSPVTRLPQTADRKLQPVNCSPRTAGRTPGGLKPHGRRAASIPGTGSALPARAQAPPGPPAPPATRPPAPGRPPQEGPRPPGSRGRPMGARTTDDPRRGAGRLRGRRPRLLAPVLCAALLAAGMSARAHDGEAALGAAVGLGLAGALATTVGLGSVALARLRRALRRTRARLRHEIRTRRAVEAARAAGEAPSGTGGHRALQRSALYDPLTELPNRASFLDHLARRLSACLRSGQGLAVAMLDLDGFKEVNDTLGHHHGDRLLQAVAARLRANVRASDLVARWSGDEFVLLLADAGSENAARAATGKVLDALARPLEVEGQPIYIQASAGIALAPEDGTEPDTLIRRADAAMYRAKERRSGIERYVPEEDPYSRQRLELAAELAGDLRSGAARLAVWYQPQVALATARVVAAEALLRWRRADGTPVRPDRAVVVAERAGLIRPLTFRVLELAFTHVAGWQARGLGLELAVNLSPWMLNDPNLAREVLRRLESAGLAPA
ncbi:MAG TPA: bifunctional diguanylate cyclase/phosphodiesterase, partial [Chromatiales bacterium]|nr:bifunctional diguanylate cyclase/phosphodiesterase [Chromatiales bacterium]